MIRKLSTASFILLFTFLCSIVSAQEKPLKIFISVDMEGIGGIGTAKMTRGNGKDYSIGRRLMTDEVNIVVKAIFEHGPADILVNDSHGDMQNLYHTELDERVTYIQGNLKPLGMVQGWEESFDGVIFIGYHSKAGDPNGFLAHTGSGSVKGLWLNDIEVGEGGLNAAFAGELGVPVILACGDLDLTKELKQLLGTNTVSTKEAITPQVAKLVHPKVVHKRLTSATKEALRNLDQARPYDIGTPVRIKMKLASTMHVDILQAIPGMGKGENGFTVTYTAKNMNEAYKLIRLMYKYISY